MKSKIRVLDEHTINKIAAGEVIENPASVVKELVENALDAGASEIVVEIKGGGRTLIRISDNGCGMDADDALLCLERHATSKIRGVEQIHEIETMGFRGEAIPSIASISKFSLITSTADQAENAPPLGTMLLVDAGKILSSSPAVRTKGTTIEVKSLFHNLPVRKKFLKSPAIDANEIHKILNIVSLGYPEVKLQLMNEGKTIFTYKPDPTGSFTHCLDKRLAAILGAEFLKSSAVVTRESDELKIQGRVGLPSESRTNRTGQYLFINRRPVFSPLIAYAVKQGYGSSLPDARHPAFVLHFTIPGSLIDVNVHPQKKEVRFRHEFKFKESIIQTIQSALYPKNSYTTPPESMLIGKQAEAGEFFRRVEPDASELYAFSASENESAFAAFPQHAECFLPQLHQAQNTDKHSQDFFQRTSNLKTLEPDSAQPGLPLERLLPPRVLATIPRYIFLEGLDAFFLKKCFPGSIPGGIVLVDQKAAHARVIFDALRASKKGNTLAQQTLLVPYQIELAAHEADLLRFQLQYFKSHSISIQEFGRNSFLIDAIPQIFANSNLEQLFKAIFSDLATFGYSQETDEKMHREIDKKLALAASRAAVSNAQLSLLEAQELVRELLSSTEFHQSPSGKRTMAYLSSEELSKHFVKMV